MPLWHSVLINSVLNKKVLAFNQKQALLCDCENFVAFVTSSAAGGAKLASSDQGRHGDGYEEGQEEVRGDQRKVTPEFQ